MIIQKIKSKNIIRVNNDIHPEIQNNEIKLSKNNNKKEEVNREILETHSSNMNDIEFIIRQKERHFDNINIKKNDEINDDNNSEELLNENNKNVNQININNDTIEVNKITGRNGIPVTINKLDTSEIGNYEVSDDLIPIQFINSLSGSKIDENNYNPLKIHNGIICDKIISLKNNFIILDENITFSKIPIILEEGTTLITNRDLLTLVEEINNLKIKIELLQEIVNNQQKINIDINKESYNKEENSV